MIPHDVHHRLQILQFFARHGVAATGEAFGVSRRTLYRWKRGLTQAGGDPQALAARSSPATASSWHTTYALDACDITHWWTYPRSPKMNAHAERFNRTLQEQFMDDHEDLLFDDLAAVNRKLADWLLAYHTVLPHHSLGRQSPVQFLIQHQPECQRWWTYTRP